MKVVDGGGKVLAALVAILPLVLAWLDLQRHLTEEGAALSRNPAVLAGLAFGSAYAATGSVEHVLAAGLVVCLAASLLADVDLSRYARR